VIGVHSLLNVALHRLNGQLHAPAALPPGKEPVVLIEKEPKWAAGLVWTLWEYRKISSPFLQFNKESLVVRSVASHYTGSQSGKEYLYTEGVLALVVL
jgi:hypothetical protein